MNGDSWAQLLTDPHTMTDLYDSLPDLSCCDLFYVHVDERESSVTLGFDTSYVPVRPLPEWQEKNFNAFEFHLRFSSISELRVSGWSAPARKTVLMSAGDDGGLRFSARGPGSLLEFASGQAEVARTRTYLASAAP